MTDEREMMNCCKDCSYQCTQYDDLTEFCGCDFADMEFFGRTEPKPECPWEESEGTE